MFQLEECLAFILNNASKTLTDVLNDRFMELGITRVQWAALYYLGKNESMSQCELGKKLEIKHPSVARLIGRMEKEGYLKKVKNQEDRRITNIELTERGKKIRARILPECERLSEQFIQGIPEERIEVFKDVLNNMVINAHNQ